MLCTNHPLLLNWFYLTHRIVKKKFKKFSTGLTSVLLEYLAGTELEIVNRSKEPTFLISNGAEVIDITFGTHALMGKLLNGGCEMSHHYRNINR